MKLKQSSSGLFGFALSLWHFPVLSLIELEPDSAVRNSQDSDISSYEFNFVQISTKTETSRVGGCEFHGLSLIGLCIPSTFEHSTREPV